MIYVDSNSAASIKTKNVRCVMRVTSEEADDVMQADRHVNFANFTLPHVFALSIILRSKLKMINGCIECSNDRLISSPPCLLEVAYLWSLKKDEAVHIPLVCATGMEQQAQPH